MTCPRCYHQEAPELPPVFVYIREIPEDGPQYVAMSDDSHAQHYECTTTTEAIAQDGSVWRLWTNKADRMPIGWQRHYQQPKFLGLRR